MRSRESQKPLLHLRGCPSKRGHASPAGTRHLAAFGDALQQHPGLRAAQVSLQPPSQPPPNPPAQPPPQPFILSTSFPRNQKKASEGPEWGLGEMGSLGAGSLPWESASTPLALCSQTRCVLRMGTASSLSLWALTSSREICTFACERNE